MYLLDVFPPVTAAEAAASCCSMTFITYIYHLQLFCVGIFVYFVDALAFFTWCIKDRTRSDYLQQSLDVCEPNMEETY